MSEKTDLQQQLVKLGGEPGDKTINQLKAAIKQLQAEQNFDQQEGSDEDLNDELDAELEEGSDEDLDDELDAELEEGSDEDLDDELDDEPEEEHDPEKVWVRAKVGFENKHFKIRPKTKGEAFKVDADVAEWLVKSERSCEYVD